MNIKEIIREEIEKLELKPNVSRSTGFGTKLVYLSISKSYANAYANGQTSAAHVYRSPVANGVIFHICLPDNMKHYGGDIWISGYQDEVIDDLTEYRDDNGVSLDTLTKEILYACGLSDEPSVEEINNLLTYFNNDDLSPMSALEWSAIQETYGGYSEICVKQVTMNEIIKAEVFQNGEIVKVINGNSGGCETTFYHGSPLMYWQHLLK